MAFGSSRLLSLPPPPPRRQSRYIFQIKHSKECLLAAFVLTAASMSIWIATRDLDQFSSYPQVAMDEKDAARSLARKGKGWHQLLVQNQQDQEQRHTQGQNEQQSQSRKAGLEPTIAISEEIESGTVKTSSRGVQRENRDRGRDPGHGQVQGQVQANTTAAAEAKASASIKRILFYTGFWRYPDFRFGLGGPEIFEKSKCAVTRCATTTYKSVLHQAQRKKWTKIQQNDYLGTFDAVVFSILKPNLNLDDDVFRSIQQWRRPHQRFVFFGYENPEWPTKTQAHFDNFFNWTMTYRWDSDVPLPYGWFTETTNENIAIGAAHEGATLRPALPKLWKKYDQKKVEEYFKGQLALNGTTPESAYWVSLAKRPKQAAWMVSNCNKVSSMRNEYAWELEKSFPINYFGGANEISKFCFNYSGRCGIGISGINEKRTNPSSAVPTVDCDQTIAHDYKFYLAFENSMCNEYATEKVYAHMSHAIAVSFTQANLSQLLPPHSVVSVLDYDSPKALAEYLRYLDQNDVAYLSYFWWQRHYRVHSLFRNDAGFCLLCEKLHLVSSSERKVYDKVMEWWVGQSECGKSAPKIKAMLTEETASSKAAGRSVFAAKNSSSIV